MSQINEFLGQPRNDSPCAAVEFWRGSLSQGRNLSYAQTLDSGEWLYGINGLHEDGLAVRQVLGGN